MNKMMRGKEINTASAVSHVFPGLQKSYSVAASAHLPLRDRGTLYWKDPYLVPESSDPSGADLLCLIPRKDPEAVAAASGKLI